ncbi:MAG: GNAT family N-acetyltransferase [Gemmatimonadota bacterium]
MDGSESLQLRIAGPDDADTVAALHCASWRSAYRGMLDDEFLDGPLEEYSARRWRAWFTLIGGPPSHLLLAEQAGTAVGFVCVLHCGGEFGDLIANLHVAAECRSSGIGSRLLRAAASRIRAEGANAMHLWVYTANEDAVRFYHREGGTAESEQPHLAADGKMRPSWRYVWYDLAGRFPD